MVPKGLIVLWGMLLASVLSASEHVVSQKDKAFMLNGQFVEHLQIEVGDQISFLNEDPFYHNVFSSSEVSRFDLGVFPRGERRSVTFDEVGVVELECAIHPYMYFTVDVQRGTEQ